MPLFNGGVALIRLQLDEIKKGKRVRAIVIGALTPLQLATINIERQRQRQPPIIDEVLFLGKHLYTSRVTTDGYTIDDVIDQIVSAMHHTAVAVATTRMTAMQNPAPRADRYGNVGIRNMVTFECTARYPRPELFSVIPKGDIKSQKAICEDGLFEFRSERLARVTSSVRRTSRSTTKYTPPTVILQLSTGWRIKRALLLHVVENATTT